MREAHKMKKIILLFLIAAILSGCTQPVKNTGQSTSPKEGNDTTTSKGSTQKEEQDITVNIVSEPTELQGMEEEQSEIEELQALVTLVEDKGLENTDEYFK